MFSESQPNAFLSSGKITSVLNLNSTSWKSGSGIVPFQASHKSDSALKNSSLSAFLHSGSILSPFLIGVPSLKSKPHLCIVLKNPLVSHTLAKRTLLKSNLWNLIDSQVLSNSSSKSHIAVLPTIQGNSVSSSGSILSINTLPIHI